MRLAWRELRRRPSRFGVATGALTLIVVLLLFLGGLLDGLFVGSVGAIRAQDGDVFVTSTESRDSFLRSRLSPEMRERIESVEGVDRAGGLGITLLTALPAGVERASADDDASDDERFEIALMGYQISGRALPAPPRPGEAIVDERLADQGVEIGDTLEIGTTGTPLRVVGFVEQANYLLQSGIWVEPSTWRSTVEANRPDLRLGPGVFQVLVVRGSGDAAALADRIDDATGGATSSLTEAEAEVSLPGTKQQRATFLQIIGTTLSVAALVIGLFFSLLTLERTGLYGVLKALGSSSTQLFGGLALQAMAVTTIAVALGGVITLGLAAIAPPEIPLLLTVPRAVFIAVGMLVASLVGSFVSLRRVVRIDPASAIGSTT